MGKTHKDIGYATWEKKQQAKRERKRKDRPKKCMIHGAVDCPWCQEERPWEYDDESGDL
jgi:hypothetical protein